ncbi:MAG: M56 family metallopeptidase [Oscillospiraceae bacterium]|nr:M56 family metallopeptidase [Oscillospiraceae bacterium]
MAICIARQLLKKAPKIISYALWAVVGFRLVFPFAIESAFSLIPFSSAPIPAAIAIQSAPHISSDVPAVSDAVNSAVSNMLPAATLYYSVNPLQIWITVGAWVWLLGVAAMVIYGVVSFIVLKRKMKEAIWKEANIYEASNIKSPFVLGVFSPKIYLPVGLSEHERGYILLHEQTHIKRCDHIVKLVAYFVLCLHWFNPLAWLAFWLMGADMEMSCDEHVMNKFGSDINADYSMSLVRIATGKRTLGSSPLAFGEGGIKERVKRVMNFKKSSRVVIVLAVVLASVLSIGFAVSRTGDVPEGQTVSAEVYEPIADAAEDADDVLVDYRQPQFYEEEILADYNSVANNTTVIGGVTNLTFQGGNTVSVTGSGGAIVVFHGNDGLWFIPYGKEIRIANGEPFSFDEWLYNTWGVDADIDYLLERAYAERRISEFNIMVRLGNPSAEKLLDLFALSAAQGNTAFFAVMKDHALSQMSADEIDAIGSAAFERRDTAIFSLISQHLSKSQIADIFNRAAMGSNTSFFALTQDQAIAQMSADEIGAVGSAAFERRDTAIFSLILQHLSLEQREQILERAIAERQIDFVALLF